MLFWLRKYGKMFIERVIKLTKLKSGIVLEGGALRTIFSSGACDALLDSGVYTDYIVGVSAGIAYGTSYASKQSGRNLEILTRYANSHKYMGLNNLINPANRSYFNLDFTYNKIPHNLVPFDFYEFENFEGEIEAVVTSLESGNARYYNCKNDSYDFKILQASCAMPLLFPIIYLNGAPCLDGGVADAIPYKRAFQKGCKRVIVILTREREYVKSDESLQPLMELYYKKYPNFCKTLREKTKRYNECREELFELERLGKVLLISPESTEGFSRTERDVKKIKELYQSGYNITMDRIDEIKSYLFD